MPTDALTFLLWRRQKSPRERVCGSFEEADGRAYFYSVDNTEVPARARADASARVKSSVLSAIEKQPCNSKG
eukprot:8507363-Pyramimonas_sp.AAC.1